MVPELSRSADHLCQNEDENNRKSNSNKVNDENRGETHLKTPSGYSPKG